ncbi:hypothetical protein KIN20_008728 [Parelaphostrongylus tenuis]|uniref:Secreted protein n=1 Tax=Parelaphostrongylus tenuis TaxID=148309 RepID=A0AAD5MPG1_PARTN|nr:hypothetical protein KIN20_008728 [Parelaphostrongylus tenuis]
MIVVCLLALVSTAMACFCCCPPSPVQVTLCAADSGNREGHQIRVFLCGQVYD